MILPWLWGCEEGRRPFREPAEVAPTVVEAGCELELLDTVLVGGRAMGVAGDEGRLVVADATGLDVLDRDGGVRRVPVDGEPRALALDGDDVWIAAGTGGLWRLRPAGLERFAAPGGTLVDVALAGGTVWSADSEGRVLAWPRTVAVDAAPRAYAVDGWPAALTPLGDGVRVAAGAGGVFRVTAGGAEREDGAFASAVAGDWIAGRGVRRAGAPGRLEVPARPRLLGDGAGVLVASEGVLLAWDGVGDAARTALPVRTPRGLAWVGPDRVAIAGDAAGVVEVARAAGGWQVVGRRARSGVVEAVVSLDQEIAVLLEGGAAGDAVVWLAGRDLREVGRTPVPDGIGSVVVVDGALLLAGNGLWAIDLAPPPAERSAVPAGLAGRPIVGLAPLSDGRVAALAPPEQLLWLVRGPDGWESGARMETPSFTPVGIGALGGTVAIAWFSTGTVRLVGPDGSTIRERRLAAEPTGMDGSSILPGHLGAAFGRFWIPEPELGLEEVPPDGSPTRLVLLAPGAWDAAPWGEALAVAVGVAGVALVDPYGGTVIATCDLPGDVRRVAVVGDRLLAAAGGTVFVLGRGR